MRIAVVPNLRSDGAAALFQPVCDCLTAAGAHVVPVCVEGTLPSAAQITEFLRGCDAAVAIGGDGTIVHVAKAAVAICPVLGVNGGHLGFLAGLEGDELSCLDALITQAYTLESRDLLQITVHTDGGRREFLAMNEAVISRGALSRLLELHVSADGSDLLTTRGDGAIIATPTGSTAYSMSAGGPVVHPAVSCMLVTPVCPHSLVSRTHILPTTATLTVTAAAADGGEAFLTVDGEENVSFGDKDFITVTRAGQSARLIRLKAATYYDVLTEKLSGRR